ncbi:ImmA/IrrE family metallo-endopeptidase [Kiloniella litopenaei]|uniref:ImmA/IrrE family metallo-endopeptidase n=1 Tax=Kiloniella litopenaei TaxID=1549748 RepID=UPI003BAD6D5E
MNSSSGIHWTNTSVKKFAEGDNPIEKITRIARELALKAMEKGWSGPPFNPVQMSEFMGIPISANADISDARTIAETGGLKIEYNPKQPRSRVRFSIAHELAHTLFPDVQEIPRNRGGTPEIDDDWQLEMLCNIAAAEFVMPIGSIPSSSEVPSIETLMLQRAHFDVSPEAYLIRIIKTTDIPIYMFCASSIDSSEGHRHYKIDYAIPSITCRDLNLEGRLIPKTSAIHHCTAIGYTDHSEESWVTGEPVSVEYVGIPAYPGSSLPRVLGIARLNETRPNIKPIRFIHGNALEPRGDGLKIVCQMVNDKALRWGGGIARLSATKFPKAQKEFTRDIQLIPSNERLGCIHFSSEQDDIIIASLVAQAGFGRSSFPRIRYGALKTCLDQLVQKAKVLSASVHMPRIGAGSAGGEWNVIEELIEDSLVNAAVNVTIYDLPPKKKQLGLFD